MRIVFHSRSIDMLAYVTAQVYLNYRQDLKLTEVSFDYWEIPQQLGTLFFLGTDSFNNKVYLMGRGKEKKIVCKALMGFNRIFSSSGKMIFYDLSPYENGYLRLALFFNRLKLEGLARKISLHVVKGEFKQILEDIGEFYERVKSIP